MGKRWHRVLFADSVTLRGEGIVEARFQVNGSMTRSTADPAGIAAFTSVGYSLDGVEGYIFPKSTPRPYGTVRLLRKYNAVNDDHAIFPEVASIVSDMTNQGYTQNSGSDWLGWVYPNNGTRPVVY